MRAVAHEQAVADVACIPAVGDGRAEAVLAGAPREVLRHVVCAGAHALPVIGPARLKPLVADACAIERPIHDAQRRAMQHGPLHRLRGHERFSILSRGWQVERRAIRMQRAFVTGRDPFGLPVGFVEQAHRPRGDIARRCFAAVAVPEMNPPEDPFAADERCARIGDAQRLARLHAAGIPAVCLAWKKPFGLRSDEDAIRGLPLRAFGRFDLPREPRRPLRDADRFAEPFAGQASGSDRRPLNSCVGRHRQRDEPRHDPDHDAKKNVSHFLIVTAEAWLTCRMICDTADQLAGQLW